MSTRRNTWSKTGNRAHWIEEEPGLQTRDLEYTQRWMTNSDKNSSNTRNRNIASRSISNANKAKTWQSEGTRWHGQGREAGGPSRCKEDAGRNCCGNWLVLQRYSIPIGVRKRSNHVHRYIMAEQNYPLHMHNSAGRNMVEPHFPTTNTGTQDGIRRIAGTYRPFGRDME